MKSPDGSCKHCDMSFGGKCPIPIKECVASARSDLFYVIFKKLEKVGDPYLAHDHSRNKDVVVQDYKLYNQHACYNGHEEILAFGLRGRNEIVTIKSKEPIKSLNCENSVEIQIEQNKEDMEERKLDPHMEKVIDEATQKLGEEISRQIGENINKQRMKPFDLEAAKAGKPVCTRNGRKARIICFDRKDVRPIIALIKSNNDNEGVYYYYADGSNLNNYPSVFDLMMLPEKKEGWVNVYREETNNNERLIEQTIYKTRKDAFDNACPKGYITTTKINWEE